MLSAILGVLDATGKRVDAALATAKGLFRPVWIKLGTGLTATAAANGQQETIVTLSVDTSYVDARTPKLGTGTTTGNSSATIVSVALADGQAGAVTFAVVASDAPAYGWISRNAADAGVSIQSGIIAPVGSSPSAAGNFPLAVTVAPSWAAGVFSLIATGPHATINGTSNLGGGTGKVRVQVSTGTPLTSWVGTIAVDISGVVGTTEINGTNLAATYVDTTHFDLLAITFVNAWVSGGTVVEHTPRVVTWGGELRLSAVVP